MKVKSYSSTPGILKELRPRLAALATALLLAPAAWAQAPANDNCTGAIPLTVGAICTLTTGTNVNATDGATPAPSCGDTSIPASKDVWYSLVVPAGGSFNVSTSAVAGSSFDDTVVEIYSGTCNSLTSIGCNDDILDGEERFSSVTVRGQTPGNTVYVRVFGFDASVATGQFGICATLPPANDNCAGAIALTTGATCTVTTGTTVGASDGPGPAPSCGGGGAYNDVWYTTVVPAGGRIAVTTSAVAGSLFDDTVVDLFTGTCGSLTAVACNDEAGGTSFSSAVASGLTVGSTVYIRVSGFDAGIPTGQFGICATIPPPAPVNDNPAEAITLPIAATCTPLNGTNAGATTTPVSGYLNGTNPNTACGIAANPKDVWYKFTTAVSGAGSTAVAIQVTGNAAGYLRLFSSPSGAATGPFTEIACSSGGANNTVSAPLTAYTLTANTTYYVFVSGYGSNDTQGDFTICAVSVPANDAAVQSIYALGKTPTNTGQVIQAVVRNAGSEALSNVVVLLNVTGANTFNDGKIVPSLAPGASATVSFAAFTPVAVGNNTLTVNVLADDLASNNSQAYSQQVQTTTYSAADPNEGATGGSVGFTASATAAGSGIFAVKYTASVARTVTAVNAWLDGAPASVGQTVYGVVLSSTGTILGRTPDYVIQTADIGAYKTFTLATPVAVPVGEFYAGFAQAASPAGTAPFYPLGLQTETPTRLGAFYSVALTGGVPADAASNNLGRFMIEAVTSAVLSSKRSAALAQAIDVYPNPASQVFAVRLPAMAGQRTAQLTLLNTLGQQVQTRTVQLHSAGTETLVNVNGLAAGVYTLQIQTADQVATKQVVVE
ncbi:T9SS type A sorting domain-containing protein [Hymenobacter tibetensis]|uniref:T9SS type A sorting domain-containing protein n=1 Tax=Hymenobacter tibetensis TaxID=497967 RepID=A0ABY4CXT3_9BACT|nr:T9SS type A sorting domain-containing protein [Hymenobacter tibetensis]UOG75078.1 T9SS type A sorting domain-containing protein [Hymenobacter tibetensis]